MATIGLEAMSSREAEVLEALGDHLTNAQIAARLHISVRTVESHVSSLLRKLGAADRRHLAALAAEEAQRTPAPVHEMLGLPGQWTTFVGRTAELEQLASVMATNRLVTLVGPGGVGKTRLAVTAAQKVASQFPSGGAFVDLVPVSSGFVVQAVAAALGSIESPREPLQHVVHERLRAGPTLLVLDNCEHVGAAAAAFAESVLTLCPQTTVLATSRERLGVPGERVVALAPLGLTALSDHEGSDAERLFVDRAALGDLDSNQALVADICRRLDGMPLAIELAAARSQSLGLDGLLAGLDDHLRLLSRPAAANDRHGSLRNVIEWSHQLLAPEEQRLFRRLGVFAGAFDLAAAVAVVSDGDVPAVSDGIGRLVDKSLLAHGRSATGSRWRMLETVHAFAVEQLGASGEERAVRHRHLLWAAVQATEVEAMLDDGAWQDHFDPVADDLRAALLGAVPGTDDGDAFDLAMALGHLTYARRFLVEARGHLTRAADRAPDDRSAVVALRAAADVAFAEMRGEIAFDLLREASARASAAGDGKVAAISLAQAAVLAGRGPALFATRLERDELIALTMEAGKLVPDDDPEVATHLALAVAWDGQRDQERAEHALMLARRLGDPVLVSNALDAVTDIVSSEGRFKEALRLTAERVALLDQFPRHDPRVGFEAEDVFHMATQTALAAGDLHAALAVARTSVDDAINQGLPYLAANHLVMPLVLQGAFDEALVQATMMRDGWVRAGSPAAGFMAPSFFAAALVYGLRGDAAGYTRWWNLATEVAGPKMNPFSTFAGLRVALHTGVADTHDLPPTSVEQCHEPYAFAMSIEAAVVAGSADAQDRLDGALSVAHENDFVAAQLRRAAGRLHGDLVAFEDAIAGWDAIGARFERACTLLLLPAHGDEGVSELEALDCPLPAGT
jgi:predicted ATPase/DNA-binding CsgD family transcriptional regulator